MFLCSLNNSTTITDQLKSINLVAVGNLIKTSTGYSPLLLTEDAVDMSVLDKSVSTELLFDTDDVGVITSEDDFKSDTVGYYFFKGVPLFEAICSISEALDVNMHDIYMHLLSGSDAARQARIEGYFNSECVLVDIDNDWVFKRPLIRDGDAWCMMIPPDITSDELASIIKKEFCAIGGLIHNDDDELSVYFFGIDHNPNGARNYRHCMSHVINVMMIEDWCTPHTYGEKREFLVNNLAEWVNPPYVPHSREKIGYYIKEYAIALSEIAMEDPNKPFPLENRNPDGTMQFITKPFRGVRYFLKVPLSIQIAACAKVAGLSEENMLRKLHACTDPEMSL